MKTFDEAVVVLDRDDETMDANMEAFMAESFSNIRLRESILAVASKIVEELDEIDLGAVGLVSNDQAGAVEVRKRAAVCHVLQLWFEMGRMVGIEMEK